MHAQHLLLLITLFAPAVLGWGMLGHRTTALLASRFLHKDAAQSIRAILEPQSMVTASTWADYYSHTAEGRFSAPWHWIDAKDAPPHTCGVDFSRDCGGAGCIVSAIANHTSRVVDKQLELGEREMSLKWIIHFLGELMCGGMWACAMADWGAIGDIHQPLHTENLLRGGNSILVGFDGHDTNLHHVWDTAIPEKLRGGNSIRHAVTWADDLYKEIVNGRWSNATARQQPWGVCLDTSKSEECALSWAVETNKIMCAYVLPATYPKGFVGAELNGTYYDGAIEIVEKQVAIAGFRMAGWLNAIFVGNDMMEEMIKQSQDEDEKVWEVHTDEL